MKETQEKLMRLYLLGGLKDAEAASIEDEFFADDEKFEQMSEIENQLVDGYVRGRLSTEERHSFEHHYLASPVHIQRVAFARNLIEKSDSSRVIATVTEPKESWIARLAEIMGLSPAQWRLAMAAAMLLLAAASIWLVVDRARLRNEVSHLQAENETQQQRQQVLSDQIAEAQSKNEKLAKENDQLQTQRNTIEPQPPAPVTERRSIFSFILSPMLVRSGGNPQTLNIPAATDLVRLRLRLPKDDARRFQIDVRTVEGQSVWSQQVNRPRASNSLLTAQIPADLLALGDYFLTLSAVNDKGEAAEVSRYFFRVIRKK